MSSVKYCAAPFLEFDAALLDVKNLLVIIHTWTAGSDEILIVRWKGAKNESTMNIP